MRWVHTTVVSWTLHQSPLNRETGRQDGVVLNDGLSSEARCGEAPCLLPIKHLAQFVWLKKQEYMCIYFVFLLSTYDLKIFRSINHHNNKLIEISTEYLEPHPFYCSRYELYLHENGKCLLGHSKCNLVESQWRLGGTLCQYLQTIILNCTCSG
jgi:hypothetical protein